MRTFLFFLLVSGLQAQLRPEEIRMNQVQFLASHNSYKIAIDPKLLEALRPSMGDRLLGLEYNHVSFAEQLDFGLRGLEIDVVNDPKGGHFAHPKGLDLAPGQAPYDPNGEMKQPGLKVLHVPDIDYRTHAYTFRAALRQLAAWSKAHPRHLPILIMMNAKQSGLNRPGYTPAVPFDRAAFEGWDREIREELGAARLITPKMVQGKYPTLDAAVRAHAWPKLDEVRGRFLFILDEPEKVWSVYAPIPDHVLFINAPEGHPEAAVRVINEPKKNVGYIQRLVREGYFIRTRADADTREARSNDRTRLEAALESGAQMISTDYYLPDPSLPGGYSVRFAPHWNPLLLPPLRPLPAVE